MRLFREFCEDVWAGSKVGAIFLFSWWSILLLWFLFVFAEWFTDTFLGSPFWPVTCPC